MSVPVNMYIITHIYVFICLPHLVYLFFDVFQRKVPHYPISFSDVPYFLQLFSLPFLSIIIIINIGIILVLSICAAVFPSLVCIISSVSIPSAVQSVKTTIPPCHSPILQYINISMDTYTHTYVTYTPTHSIIPAGSVWPFITLKLMISQCYIPLFVSVVCVCSVPCTVYTVFHCHYIFLYSHCGAVETAPTPYFITSLL